VKRQTAILGAPGAGKGTQAQQVCAQLNLEHLSTGDLLRAAVAAGSSAGLQAKSFMDAGNLVPDEVVFGVLFERLGNESSGTAKSDGYMLDGFPRNRVQAEELDRRLSEAAPSSQAQTLDVVVDICVPDERIVARLTGRRICKGCGRNYHVEFVKPKQDGVCDDCGGELYQRSDDTESVVMERLSVYHEQTAPLEVYYKEQGILVTVDGDRAVETVTQAVLDALSGNNVAGLS
jgi:adenylate kinase